MCSKTVQGFKVFPLRFSRDSSSCHDLFIKEHSVRIYDENKPPGRTLFVLNIPPYATEKCMLNVFSSVGKIMSVILQNNINAEKTNNGFKVGYIVFEKRESLLNALKSNQLNPLSTEERPLQTGLEKWISEYNLSICNPQKLTGEIEKYMKTYEKREKQEKNKGKDEKDEDGWTVVTKKGRNPGVSKKESTENKLNEKLRKGSKKKELKNFYTFQIRESKMKNLAALRKNYEEAKKKVTLMKSTRRFKPF